MYSTFIKNDLASVKDTYAVAMNDAVFKFKSPALLRDAMTIVNYNNPLMQWIFERLKGITIATEPEHTGGLLKSNKLLSAINKIWFKPSLFTSRPGRWDKETQWKHLR